MEATGSNHINDLVRQAIAGNGTAFTALWDLHIDSLRAFVKKWLKNLDDLYIDDICSRSFEKAFRQIGTYDPDRSQFSTWLMTIARNTALDTVEHENRAHRQEVSLDDDKRTTMIVSRMEDAGGSALDNIIQGEEEDRTEKYIAGLPELYRDIARMRLVDGLQYKEIAEELDMELNTVRTRIRRAKALIDKMKQDDNEE